MKQTQVEHETENKPGSKGAQEIDHQHNSALPFYWKGTTLDNTPLYPNGATVNYPGTVVIKNAASKQ